MWCVCASISSSACYMKGCVWGLLILYYADTVSSVSHSLSLLDPKKAKSLCQRVLQVLMCVCMCVGGVGCLFASVWCVCRCVALTRAWSCCLSFNHSMCCACFCLSGVRVRFIRPFSLMILGGTDTSRHWALMLHSSTNRRVLSQCRFLLSPSALWSTSCPYPRLRVWVYRRELTEFFTTAWS
jgi:hypothetical protein